MPIPCALRRDPDAARAGPPPRAAWAGPGSRAGRRARAGRSGARSCGGAPRPAARSSRATRAPASPRSSPTTDRCVRPAPRGRRPPSGRPRPRSGRPARSGRRAPARIATMPDQPASPAAYRAIRQRSSGCSAIGRNDASWPQYSNSSRRLYAIVSRIGAGYGPSREKSGRYWVRTSTLTESICKRPIRPSTRRISRASTAPLGRAIGEALGRQRDPPRLGRRDVERPHTRHVIASRSRTSDLPGSVPFPVHAGTIGDDEGARTAQ